MNKATKAEQYLLERIRRGDEAAWSEFVNRYRGRLLSFARARVSQRADAEDVVQETFIAFIRSLRGYRGDCDVETYLFVLLRRKVIDTYRDKRTTHICLIQDTYDVEGQRTQGDDPFAEIPGPGQTASWYARADEQYSLQRAALADALSELVSGLKNALDFRDLQITELLFYCQLSNKDVAKIMAVRENLVALVKHRSLKQIRKHISKRKLPPEPSGGNFERLLTDLWESQRLSCPKRSTIGSYLLETLEPAWHEYVDFHLNVLGCRFCRANLEDLRSRTTEAGQKQLYARIMESTVGFLSTQS
ncbi:MAG: sigma-70 family RNA polymerase sigma factor [Phycisphaerales bacterium]|nr:MAG: sigma-70 family RNA polymerase sigma factor [Phycisphaerales bacterium]